MRIAVVGVALAAAAACSPGVQPGPAPAPRPLSDEVLPLSGELGEGWVRLPTTTASPEPGPAGLCPAVASLAPAELPSATTETAFYARGETLADVRVLQVPSHADAAAFVAEISRVQRLCGDRFPYVSEGRSLPATAERVEATAAGLTCDRLSLTVDDETQWYAGCRTAVGRVAITAKSWGGRGEVVPVAARLVELTRRRVAEQGAA